MSERSDTYKTIEDLTAVALMASLQGGRLLFDEEGEPVCQEPPSPGILQAALRFLKDYDHERRDDLPEPGSAIEEKEPLPFAKS